MRWRLALAGALVLVAVCRLVGAQTSPGEKPFRIRTRTDAFVKAHRLKTVPGESRERALLKARVNASLGETLGRTHDFTRDGENAGHLVEAHLRLLGAELDYFKGVERVSTLQDHLALAKELEAILETRTTAEPCPFREVHLQSCGVSRQSWSIATQGVRDGQFAARSEEGSLLAGRHPASGP